MDPGEVRVAVTLVFADRGQALDVEVPARAPLAAWVGALASALGLAGDWEGWAVAVNIRPYRPADEPAVLAIWNECLYRDMVAPDRYRNMVTLDPNVADGYLVAEEGGQVVGFLLGLVRRVPMEGLGLQEDRGWITAMAVRPDRQRQGIGSRLLAASLDWFRAQGRRLVQVSPYVPNYFMPGPDIDAYPGGVRLLEKYGFARVGEAAAMSVKLYDLRTPPEVRELEARLAAEGVRVEYLTEGRVGALMAFLAQNFPGDWHLLIRSRILRRDPLDEIQVAVHGDQVVGFSQFEGERFGPFGVAGAYRGKRIGTLLFYKAVERMKGKLRRHLWLAWTGGDAQRFYERQGLTVDRRHWLMAKEL